MTWMFTKTIVPQAPDARPLWVRAAETYRRSVEVPETAAPSRPRRHLALVRLEVLSVAAPSFFVARGYARAVMQTDKLDDQPLNEGKPDVELRFVGDDYAKGGTPEGRRLQVRRFAAGNWSDWEECCHG